MADYIDRQAAIKVFESLPNCHNGFSDTYDKACIIGVLEELPPADVETVRHGRWIRVTKDGIVPQEYRCDVCGRLLKYEGVPALLSIRYPYCHCGAKMEGSE